MSEMSNYLENRILDHILRVAAYTQPSGLYLALHTADPTDAGSGAEVTGGSYARASLTFGAASGGVSSNTNTGTYTNMPTAAVTHIAIWDASTAGNLLYHTPITTINFNSGDGGTIAAAAITVSQD